MERTCTNNRTGCARKGHASWIHRFAVCIGLLTLAVPHISSALQITNGMPADNVIGQPNFSSSGFQTTQTGVSFPDPFEVAVVGGTKYLIAGDFYNHRVLFYNISSGITNGMAASYVLGQPDFTTGTANTACGGGSSGTTNPCGMNGAGSPNFDPATSRLFVGDSNNGRILVFDLSSGITNGMAASYVLGQPDFSTNTANTQNSSFGCTTARNACGLGNVSLVTSFDSVNHRLFVADGGNGLNNRVLVFDLTSGITNGMPASYVLGQPDFMTGTSDTACGGGSSGTANPCGLDYPVLALFDPSTSRLFVDDLLNRRVLVFNLSSGITNGMAASYVLGQPDFTTETVNTACLGGSSGSTNPCGMNLPNSMTYRASTNQLFVGDLLNGRVTVFDLSSGITNGMAASLVLGQADLFTAASPYQNAAFGCTGTYSACTVDPISLGYDAGSDLLFVGNLSSRITVFGANVGGSPVEATGNAVSIITTTNGDGSKTFTVTDTLGKTFQVTFPAGTTPLTGETSITLQVTASSSNPKIKVSAQLPVGQTKTVSLPRGTGNKVCVKDQAGATLGGSCPGANQVRIPAAGQSCSYPSSQCDGLSSGQTISTSADNTTITVSGLVNTVIEVIHDTDDDGVIDEEDHCTSTDTAGPIPTVSLRPNHLGDDQVILGCNASQILACKPGQNEGERKFGLTPGSQNIFLSKTSANPMGWAQQCLVMYPNL